MSMMPEVNKNQEGTSSLWPVVNKNPDEMMIFFLLRKKVSEFLALPKIPRFHMKSVSQFLRMAGRL